MPNASSTRFENIIKSKCPKCHIGYLFKNKNPYNFKAIFKMNDRCSNCRQSFSPEPRFYDGAMYVSYAFSVIVLAFVFIFFNIFFKDPPLLTMIFTTISTAFLLSPISFRLSRSIWIHVFYKFDKSKQ